MSFPNDNHPDNSEIDASFLEVDMPTAPTPQTTYVAPTYRPPLPAAGARPPSRPPYGAPASGGVPWGALIFGVIGLTVVAAVALGYRWVTGFMSDARTMVQKAQAAPGVKELRARGCDVAVVMSDSDVARLGRSFGVGGVGMSVVMCQVHPSRVPPTCDALADTYVAAATPASDFMVVVKQQGSRESVCQSSYQADGSLKR